MPEVSGQAVTNRHLKMFKIILEYFLGRENANLFCTIVANCSRKHVKTLCSITDLLSLM
jgi:hypothetical protein